MSHADMADHAVSSCNAFSSSVLKFPSLHLHHRICYHNVMLPIASSLITTLKVNESLGYSSLLLILARVCDTLLSLSFYPSESEELHTLSAFHSFKILFAMFGKRDPHKLLP
jgi:hypothetical protein